MRRGRSLSSTFLKIGRKCSFLGKKVLILIIYRINFSFKMQFLSFSWRKSQKIFPVLPFIFLFFCPLTPRKLLYPDKFLVPHLYLNDLSVDCSRKELNQRFFGRALYKNHENAKCPDFQFHNLKLVKKSILDPSCYYSLWHIYERRNWKLPS